MFWKDNEEREALDSRQSALRFHRRQRGGTTSKATRFWFVNGIACCRYPCTNWRRAGRVCEGYKAGSRKLAALDLFQSLFGPPCFGLSV